MDNTAHLTVNDVRLDLGPRCVEAMEAALLTWDGDTGYWTDEAVDETEMLWPPTAGRLRVLALAAFKTATRAKYPRSYASPSLAGRRRWIVFQNPENQLSIGEGDSEEAAWAAACEKVGEDDR